MAFEETLTSVPDGVGAPRQTITATQLAGASVGLGSVTLWLGLLGLITTPIMIHSLQATRYGVFALISIMSAYLMNLEFGFGTATVQFLARAHATGDQDEQTRVLGTSLAVFLIGGVVATSAALGGAPWIAQTFFHGPPRLRPEATDAVRLGAVILFLSFLSAFASVALQALSRFPTVVIARGVFGTLASAAAVAAVLAGGHLRLVLSAQVAVAAGMCLTLMVTLTRARGRWTWPRIHGVTLKMMARYGMFILAGGLAYQALLQGPPTVLAHLAPTSAVAAFAVPNLILGQLVGISTSTSIGFMPFATAASIHPDRSRIAAVFLSNVRMTLLFTGPVAIFLSVFAHPLLRVWIGSQFAVKAAPPLQFLSIALVMLAMTAAPSDVARGFGHPRWIAGYTSLAAAAAIGISIAVAQRYEAAGIGFALAAALSVTTVPFLFMIAWRMLAIRPSQLLASLVRPGLALSLLAALFLAGNTISGGFAMGLVAGAVGTACYALGVFGWVLNPNERDVLRGAWRAVRDRLCRTASKPGFVNGLIDRD